MEYSLSFYGSQDFLFEVSKGNVPGHTLASSQGFNDDIDTANIEGIWGFDGELVYPTANEQWEIVSSDAADTSAGTGAQTVTVNYLDDSYVQQTTTVTLSGVTPVNLTPSDSFRPISAFVASVGSGGENAGDLIIRVTAAGDNRISIKAGINNSQDIYYTIPDGKTGFITSIGGAAGSGKDGALIMSTTTGDDGIFLELVPISLSADTVIIQPPGFEKVIARSDIKITGISDNVNTPITASFQLILVDN